MFSWEVLYGNWYWGCEKFIVKILVEYLLLLIKVMLLVSFLGW